MLAGFASTNGKANRNGLLNAQNVERISEKCIRTRSETSFMERIGIRKRLKKKKVKPDELDWFM